MTVQVILLVIGSYLLGSVPIGLLLGRALKGVDIREYGSGKTGTTNTLRTLGKGPAVVALLGDVLKGVIPVLVAKALTGDAWVHVAAALAAILGHDFPIYAGFRGGRGVSSSLGATGALMPVLIPVMPLLGGAILLKTGIVSLMSIGGTAVTGVIIVVLALMGRVPAAYGVYAVIAATLIIVLHRENIERLRAGTEPKIGKGGERRVAKAPGRS